MKALIFSAIALGILTGCSSIENPGKKIADLASAPMPAYKAGDTFVYNDGYSEQVLSVAVNEVSWALGPTATVVTRTPNFFDPPLKWELEQTKYQFIKSSRLGSLWPMQKGAKESLSGQMTTENRNSVQSFDQRWDCDVTHSEQIKLSVGSFNTFVVDCKRQSESGAHWQRRRFNYAPSLGHYVRVIEEMRAYGYPGYVFKQRDLMYYRTKNSDNFISTFQHALGTLSSGQSFTADNNGFIYKAELKSTSMNESKMICRELQVTDERSKNYLADYCLTNGAWSIRALKLQSTKN